MCGIYSQNFVWDLKISWEPGSQVPRDSPTLALSFTNYPWCRNLKLSLGEVVGGWWVRAIIRIKANLSSTELANWNLTKLGNIFVIPVEWILIFFGSYLIFWKTPSPPNILRVASQAHALHHWVPKAFPLLCPVHHQIPKFFRQILDFEAMIKSKLLVVGLK